MPMNQCIVLSTALNSIFLSNDNQRGRGDQLCSMRWWIGVVVDILYKSKVWCDDELESYFDGLHKSKVKTLSHEITGKAIKKNSEKFYSFWNLN